MRLLLTILLIALSVAATDARRTTRRGLRPAPVEVSDSVAEAPGDTIAVAEGDFTLAGFEKPLRSRRESFFVTNNTDHDIIALRVKLIYYDLDDRMLDSRIVDADVDLAAGETCRVYIRAWDLQDVFYYYRSARPRSGVATPFKVAVTVTGAVAAKDLYKASSNNVEPKNREL